MCRASQSAFALLVYMSVCLVRCSYCVANNTFRSLTGVGLIMGDIEDAIGSQSVLMSVTPPTKGR